MRLINRGWTCEGRRSFITFASSFSFTCFFFLKRYVIKTHSKLTHKRLCLRKILNIPLKLEFRPLQAAICRSSQPLSGFSARCLEDEHMLEAILRSNPRSDFMYVVDTRPKVRPYSSTNFTVCLDGSGLFSWLLDVLTTKALENILDMFPWSQFKVAYLAFVMNNSRNLRKKKKTRKTMIWNVCCSWTRSPTGRRGKATKMKTTTPILNSSLSASKTSTSWGTASRKYLKVIYWSSLWGSFLNWAVLACCNTSSAQNKIQKIHCFQVWISNVKATIFTSVSPPQHFSFCWKVELCEKNTSIFSQM